MRTHLTLAARVWAVALTSLPLAGLVVALPAQDANKQPAVGAGGQTGAKAALPPGVYARLNGNDITREQYAEYLLASIGKARLGEYIDRLLIQDKARELSVIVSDSEVEALVEERIDRTIKGIYRGNREGFLEGLARQNTTLEDRKAKLRQQTFFERLLEKLILKQRQVTPEDVEEQFERTYGPGGVRYELRHILISTGKRIGASGESLPVRSEAEARELAEKTHREILSGGDFVQLVKRYSDDTFTARNDGRVPLYREGFYGKEFHVAVTQLTKENPVSGVVRSSRGFHLIQLVSKEVTELESVREEIEKLVRERPASARERHEMIQKLRENAKIER